MKALKKAWKAWTALTAKLGAAAAWVLLALFHFLAVTPLALLYRGLHRERKTAGSRWRDPGPLTKSLEDGRRQY